MVLDTDNSKFGLYSIIGLGERGVEVLDRSKIPLCLSFFFFCFFFFLLLLLLLPLALTAILFSRAGRFEHFGRGSPKEPSCEIIETSVQQCQRWSLLKQKLQCMHVNFYGKSAPLLAFQGLMIRGANGWMNKQTNGRKFGYFGLISNIIPNIE